MKVARLKLRIIDKFTRRTYIALWPWTNGVAFCMMIGSKRIVTHVAGYSEYNDCGQPVLDSWIEPINYVTLEK